MVPLSRLGGAESTGRMPFDPFGQQLGLTVHTAAQAGDDESLGPAGEDRDPDAQSAFDGAERGLTLGAQPHRAATPEAVPVDARYDRELRAMRATVEHGLLH